MTDRVPAFHAVAITGEPGDHSRLPGSWIDPGLDKLGPTLARRSPSQGYAAATGFPRPLSLRSIQPELGGPTGQRTLLMRMPYGVTHPSCRATLHRSASDSARIRKYPNLSSSQNQRQMGIGGNQSTFALIISDFAGGFRLPYCGRRSVSMPRFADPTRRVKRYLFLNICAFLRIGFIRSWPTTCRLSPVDGQFRRRT